MPEPAPPRQRIPRSRAPDAERRRRSLALPAGRRRRGGAVRAVGNLRLEERSQLRERFLPAEGSPRDARNVPDGI